MTVGSTNWHRPIVLPLGELASSDANDLRHAVNDANIPCAVLTGLQMDASPGLHESKTITAAVAGSIKKLPLLELSTRAKPLCSHFAKIRDVAFRLRGLSLVVPTVMASLRLGHQLADFLGVVAEGVGFEPTVNLRPRRFSRPVP